MDKLILDKDYIDEHYWKQEKSIHQIAEELGTYPNKVRRAILQHYSKLRDKSKAQSLALSQGRHKHPTRGTNRSQETKDKISLSVASKWKGISEDERQRRVNLAKERWASMPDDGRAEMSKKAIDAFRKAAKEGSRLEKFLLDELRRAGYSVMFHTEAIAESEKMHVDLIVPELQAAIEVDGPSHFFPIWGEESLRQHIQWDNEKNGLLINAGYTVIRIKVYVNTVSRRVELEVLDKLLFHLKKLKDEGLTKQYIEIEVK
jgi:very-short-patch-repair endonuclease